MANRYSARQELLTKSAADIDRETAEKWCERACVAYELYAETGKQKYLLEAVDFRHEALEHAATVGDGGKTLAKVEKKIKSAVRQLSRAVAREGGPLKRSRGRRRS